MNQLSPLRRRCPDVAALVLVLLAASCDDVPTVKELTGESPTGEAPTQFVPEQQAAPDVGPPVSRPQPVVRTPEQILEDFLATESQSRTHKQLEELAALEDSLREQITKLDLRDSLIGDPSAEFLSRFPAVHEVDLTGTRISNQGLSELAKVDGLRKLTLDRMNINGQGLEALASNDQIRELSLAETSLSDSSLEHLLKLEQLEVLRLSGIRDLNGVGFNAFVKDGAFPNLRELHVSGTNFGYYGLSNVHQLPSLEVLVARHAELTDQAMVGIAGCKNLKELDLSNNLLGDNALKPLARFRQLESLKIRDCDGITDAGLNHLRGLESLKRLELGNVQCTLEAVRSPEREVL